MQDPRCNMQWKHKDNFQGSICNIQLNRKKFQISNFKRKIICKIQYAIGIGITKAIFKGQYPISNLIAGNLKFQVSNEV